MTTIRETDWKELRETDGDETMMDNHGNDEAGETGAVRAKNQPLKPLDQDKATS